MEENLQRQLYKELDRLQSVIDVLLEQNAQLKKTICHYEQMLKYPANVPHPFVSGVDGATAAFSADPLAEQQAQRVQHSYVSASGKALNVQHAAVSQNIGVINVQRHTAPQNEGVASVQHSIASHNTGVINVQHASGLKNIGVANVWHHTSLPNIGVINVQQPAGWEEKEVINESSPLHEAMNDTAIDSLYLHESRSALITFRQASDSGNLHTNAAGCAGATLQTGLPQGGNVDAEPEKREKQVNTVIVFNQLTRITPTSSYSGLENTLDILLVLQQSPKQSLKDLRKVTGLSEDGMVKRIMAMKKAGLIVRAPHKRLLYLTPKAKQMLEEAKI